MTPFQHWSGVGSLVKAFPWRQVLNAAQMFQAHSA